MHEKTAIVTGGVRGVGFAIAGQLVELGYKVVICSRTNLEIRSALKQLNLHGRVAFGLKTDVSQYAQCKRLVTFAFRKLGSIGVLVNNAGIYGPIGYLESNAPEKWSEAIRVNLLGTVYCSQLVTPIMKRNGGGKIINLCGGGVGGKSSLPGFSAYYTSKVAIAGFTEVLSEEVRLANIQVNCIAPGAVNSSLTDYLIDQGIEKAGEAMYKKTLEQKRNGGDSPQLAGKLVAFLVSEKSAHITGCLLSAKWDSFQAIGDQNAFSPSLYKLRRIDHNNFIEKL
ncbi:MAG: dehydrogenase [Candidatus Daviesbacteria bacterium GW2011_GWA1_38_7]|nr:MAG: dehydrogenase [Candidatus Daviesbacteria bacterium GW2011_GWA1_38_7]